MGNKKELTEQDILDMGYSLARQTEQGVWLAVMPMLFTVGLFYNIDWIGYECRYCYETNIEAIYDFINWDGVGEPPGNWVAKK